MLFNPVLAMLFNTALKRWHPILFVEAPLPGPPSADKPVRHRSRGHHTVGFATRYGALVNAVTSGRNPEVNARFAMDEDMLWDGQGVPASVVFFDETQLATTLDPAADKFTQLAAQLDAAYTRLDVILAQPPATRNRTFRFEA